MQVVTGVGGQASHITGPQVLQTKPAGGPGGEMQGLASPSSWGSAPGHAQQPVRSLAMVQSAGLAHSSPSRQLPGLLGSGAAMRDGGGGNMQFSDAQRSAAGHAAITAGRNSSPDGTRHGSLDMDAALTAMA